MSEATRSILAALFAGDTVAEQQRLDAIYEYAQAAAAGKDAAALLPATSTYISNDEAAYQHFQAVRILLETPEQVWLRPPLDAEFDLSFLPQPATVESRAEHSRAVSAPTWLLEAGRLIVRFSRDSLADLAVQTGGEPAYAKSGHDRTLFTWRLEQPEDDFVLAVTARELDRPEMCDLIVAVEIPSRGGWPHLADIPITLSPGPMSPSCNVKTTRTDSFGKARFSTIPATVLSTLTLEVDFSPPEDAT